MPLLQVQFGGRDGSLTVIMMSVRSATSDRSAEEPNTIANHQTGGTKQQSDAACQYHDRC
jgi:hypothetical protein